MSPRTPIILKCSKLSSRCCQISQPVTRFTASYYHCGGSRWSLRGAHCYLPNSRMPAFDIDWWSSTTPPQSHRLRSRDKLQSGRVAVRENGNERDAVWKVVFTAPNATRNRQDVGPHICQPKTTKPRLCAEVWRHKRRGAKFIFCGSRGKRGNNYITINFVKYST